MQEDNLSLGEYTGSKLVVDSPASVGMHSSGSSGVTPAGGGLVSSSGGTLVVAPSEATPVSSVATSLISGGVVGVTGDAVAQKKPKLKEGKCPVVNSEGIQCKTNTRTIGFSCQCGMNGLCAAHRFADQVCV